MQLYREKSSIIDVPMTYKTLRISLIKAHFYVKVWEKNPTMIKIMLSITNL